MIIKSKKYRGYRDIYSFVDDIEKHEIKSIRKKFDVKSLDEIEEEELTNYVIEYVLSLRRKKYFLLYNEDRNMHEVYEF